ncbi:MAG: T9SS type A sorting domain-containing protein [Bacteroidales bacterium]|nr:T9SS type A sorting domain-containing protein [Bacteroidales bacterium]
MMKKIFLLAFIVALISFSVSAQTRMAVPRGSFEQWTTNPGYNVSLFGLSLPVFSSFTTPTGWNYLSYPVNESASTPLGNVSINTNLPLVLASQETTSVPDSNYAVKLQTFMLEDIINPNIYSLVEANLDTMLTQTVFPSILSTGTVNLDHFIPIMNSLLSNMDSLEAILASFATMDVNYLITGGIALGSFEPSRLTGYYKYQSATSGDNGGVLMLGTHYNTTTHQRDVVGGGANVALSDISNYTPFTVDYVSLHEMEPSFPEQAPDSLIILLISSASATMQQGSYLCVDNLALWHDSNTVVEPDTCAGIVGLAATPDIHEAVVNWSTTAVVSGFELEYGAAGFTQGGGTLVSLTNNTYTFSGLAANTTYDVYVRSVCSNNTYGDWVSLTFTTLQDTCTSVLNLEVRVIGTNPAGYELYWESSFDPEGWELEYGLRGFAHGVGTLLTPTEPGVSLSSLNLRGNNWYDFYVRSLCGNNIYGEWALVQFHTDPDTCAVITQIEVDSSDASITPAGEVAGYILNWHSSFQSDAWEVQYDSEGFEPGTATSHVVHDASMPFDPLQPSTMYDVYVRSICNDSIYGEWEHLRFFTRSLPVGIGQLSSIQMEVTPNPAYGRCVVSVPEAMSGELKLYALDGRLLQTVECHGVPITLQLPDSGVYLIQVTTDKGTSTCKVVNR